MRRGCGDEAITNDAAALQQVRVGINNVQQRAGVGPLRLEERLNKQYPEAADETRCIVSCYLRESFAGEELSAGELEAVKSALAGAKKKLRKSA